jgi:hypothetical protein
VVSKSKAMDLDRKLLEPIAQMKGEDAKETGLLRQMYEDANRWLAEQPWATPVKKSYYALGVGNVVALFVFELKKRAGTDERCLWVVTGDLPPAAFPTQELPDAAEALEWYCGLMEDWTRAVLDKKDLSEVYPVEAKPTRENARQLASRVKSLRKEIIPEFRKALDEARSG